MKQEYPKRAAAGGWQGKGARGTAMSNGAEIRRRSRSAGRALAMVIGRLSVFRTHGGIEGNPCGM